MEVKLIKGGTFQMDYENGTYDKKPGHLVTLSDFYMGTFEVTQSVWEKIMNNNPSFFKGVNKPVECVNIQNIDNFIHKLNLQTGKNYRLPTEAEWEYSALGGNLSKGYKYAGSNILEDVAWNYSNSNNQTQPVGTKQPNELGLYDISGNVYERCSDYYGLYDNKAQINPIGALYNRPPRYVMRGGCYNLFEEQKFHSTSRAGFHVDPYTCYKRIGFRLAHSS